MAEDAVTVPNGALIADFQAGRSDAFGHIFRRYHDALLRICLASARDHHRAEDLLQETFLRAYRGLGSLSLDANLNAWLRTIASNVCIDHARTAARHGRNIVLEEDLVETTPSPEHLLDAATVDLGGAWLSLSPLHRRALELRHLEGESHAEIATLLGLSATQAKGLIHRALRALRTAWQGAARGEAALSRL